ncbi:MAG: AMP-binding protein, partial [Solirubrobacterales bacterium]|nr:AMP-binding protein [Solirubrobacterales bacterium]
FSATDAWFAPGAADIWTMFHSYAFDFSVWELWGALLHGGTLVVVPRSVTRSPAALADLLVSERVTVLSATPSLFAAAMDELLDRAEELSLRLVVFGGEALSPRTLRRWFERCGDQSPRLVNMYGITETTVHVTYRPLRCADAEQDRSPIGVPIPDLALYLLDGALSPVAPGVAGELFVGGAGVARGYLNRPELTAERFIQNPFGPGRLYRSGDRARWSRDQGFSFEGRIDDQVKVRGFRIELGEIRAALIDHEVVADAVVLAHQGPQGDTRLAAYVVLKSSGRESASLRGELRAALQERLPEYMIPSSFTVLDELPLTANGKLDRKALPAPVPDRTSEDAAVAPRTATEAALVGIWRELLGAETIGIHDDFFELGGHSLLALSVLAEVERVLGVEVPLKRLFESGTVTVAGLAAKIEVPPKREAGGKTGVSLERSDSSPILFFVHADEPTMVTLRHFVSRLGPDVRLEGLVPERAGGPFDRSESVEGMARPMLDTIRRMQPRGPYYIAGFSLGGLLAYEIAGRLRAAGEPVAWLGVLDAATPAVDTRWLRSHYSLRQWVPRQWQRGPRGELAKIGEVARRKLTSQMVRLHLRQPDRAWPAYRVKGSLNLPRFDHLSAVKLGARYACVGHDAPMDLFATEPRIALASSDSLGWEEVHRGVLRVHRVAVDHSAVVTGAHVARIAQLNALYARAAEIVSTDVKEARRVWETN